MIYGECQCVVVGFNSLVDMQLTNESLDAETLYLHVHQQSAVGLYQWRGQGRHVYFVLSQFDDPSHDAVDQTDTNARWVGELVSIGLLSCQRVKSNLINE